MQDYIVLSVIGLAAGLLFYKLSQENPVIENLSQPERKEIITEAISKIKDEKIKSELSEYLKSEKVVPSVIISLLISLGIVRSFKIGKRIYDSRNINITGDPNPLYNLDIKNEDILRIRNIANDLKNSANANINYYENVLQNQNQN